MLHTLLTGLCVLAVWSEKKKEAPQENFGSGNTSRDSSFPARSAMARALRCGDEPVQSWTAPFTITNGAALPMPPPGLGQRRGHQRRRRTAAARRAQQARAQGRVTQALLKSFESFMTYRGGRESRLGRALYKALQRKKTSGARGAARGPTWSSQCGSSSQLSPEAPEFVPGGWEACGSPLPGVKRVRFALLEPPADSQEQRRTHSSR